VGCVGGLGGCLGRKDVFTCCVIFVSVNVCVRDGVLFTSLDRYDVRMYVYRFGVISAA
jgi:hypothetical protein